MGSDDEPPALPPLVLIGPVSFLVPEPLALAGRVLPFRRYITPGTVTANAAICLEQGDIGCRQFPSSNLLQNRRRRIGCQALLSEAHHGLSLDSPTRSWRLEREGVI